MCDLRVSQAAAELMVLEQDRQRARLCRALHDRVLQTLEFLAVSTLISDAKVRAHVGADATWLRGLIEAELAYPVQGLAAELERVFVEQTAAGMDIKVNAAGLRCDPVPTIVVDALTGAVSELLTNVRKHSGTTRAVVRAVSGSDRITVTVLDQGRGFDVVRVRPGLGLRESVMARIRQAGGKVVITSKSGAGTHVEISLPCATV